MKKDDIFDRTLSAAVVFLFLLILWLLFGCTASKTIRSGIKETQYVNERTTQKTVSETVRSVDTTRVSSVESAAFKVEYFNPSEVDDYAALLQLMRDRNEPYSEYGIVKSVSGSMTKAHETQSGIGEESGKTTTDTDKSGVVETKKEEKTTVKTESFLAKYKWYLAGLIVSGILLFGTRILMKWVNR